MKVLKVIRHICIFIYYNIGIAYIIAGFLNIYNNTCDDKANFQGFSYYLIWMGCLYLTVVLNLWVSCLDFCENIKNGFIAFSGVIYILIIFLSTFWGTNYLLYSFSRYCDNHIPYIIFIIGIIFSHIIPLVLMFLICMMIYFFTYLFQSIFKFCCKSFCTEKLEDEYYGNL